MDMEERLDVLTNLAQQLALAMANNVRQNDGRVVQEPRPTEDKTIRIELPDFDWHSQNPQDYTDWEANIARYFEYKNTLQTNNID